MENRNYDMGGQKFESWNFWPITRVKKGEFSDELWRFFSVQNADKNFNFLFAMTHQQSTTRKHQLAEQYRALSLRAKNAWKEKISCFWSGAYQKWVTFSQRTVPFMLIWRLYRNYTVTNSITLDFFYKIFIVKFYKN